MLSILSTIFALTTVALANPVARQAVSYSPPMGTACNFAILSMSGVSSVSDSDVQGDVGLSPIAITAATGFSPLGPPAGPYYSSQVGNGVTAKIYGPDSTNSPTPAALADVRNAYTNANSQAVSTNVQPSTGGYPASYSEAFGGSIPDGAHFLPGVYKWSTVVVIPVNATIYLNGTCSDVWIFIGNSFSTGAASSVNLMATASPGNVYWVSHSTLTTGANSLFTGIILAKTNVVIGTGATLQGIATAQTEIALHVASIFPPLYLTKGVSNTPCLAACGITKYNN